MEGCIHSQKLKRTLFHQLVKVFSFSILFPKMYPLINLVSGLASRILNLLLPYQLLPPLSLSFQKQNNCVFIQYPDPKQSPLKGGTFE